MNLITDLKDIQENIPVIYTSSIDRVRPFISAAERNYVIAVIGKPQYDILVLAYKAATASLLSLSEEQQAVVRAVDYVADPLLQEAIRICQRIITNLGYLTGMPLLSVNFNDTGITVSSSETQKQAFKWQIDKIEASILELGFTAIEDLLYFMEVDSPDGFPTYLNSHNYIKHNQFLITSATDFSDNLNINNSRYVFKMLSYLMKRVEEQIVSKLIGTTFFDHLKNGTLTEKESILVTNYLMPGIALLTGAKAVIERVITFKNGIASVNVEGNYDSEQNNTPATKEQVTLAHTQLTTDGNAFLQDGLQFILDNLPDFPTYQVAVPKRRYKINNDQSKGIYGT